MFDTTVAGEYSFIFGNFYSGADVAVTMALHTYEVKSDDIPEYDLDDDGNRVMRAGSQKKPETWTNEDGTAGDIKDEIDLEF